MAGSGSSAFFDRMTGIATSAASSTRATGHSRFARRSFHRSIKRFFITGQGLAVAVGATTGSDGTSAGVVVPAGVVGAGPCGVAPAVTPCACGER